MTAGLCGNTALINSSLGATLVAPSFKPGSCNWAERMIMCAWLDMNGTQRWSPPDCGIFAHSVQHTLVFLCHPFLTMPIVLPLFHIFSTILFLFWLDISAIWHPSPHKDPNFIDLTPWSFINPLNDTKQIKHLLNCPTLVHVYKKLNKHSWYRHY